MTYRDQENTGMEEVVAIVECNNCFTDGIQVVTGCTFGNNALIYKDLSKTAVTVARRELEEVDLSEQFLIETCTIQMPAFARILATEVCGRCGEGVMESRIRVQAGQTVWLACAGEGY